MVDERILETDTPAQAILKIAEEDVGAINTCINLYERGAHIDPDNILGGRYFIVRLDALGIYGSDIWILYRDVCRENIVLMCALLRAHQLEYITAAEIYDSITDRGEHIDIEDIYGQVKLRLPTFADTEEIL